MWLYHIWIEALYSYSSIVKTVQQPFTIQTVIFSSSCCFPAPKVDNTTHQSIPTFLPAGSTIPAPVSCVMVLYCLCWEQNQLQKLQSYLSIAGQLSHSIPKSHLYQSAKKSVLKIQVITPSSSCLSICHLLATQRQSFSFKARFTLDLS